MLFKALPLARRRAWPLLALGFAVLVLPSAARAQLISPNAGVVISPEGVLRKQVYVDETGQLQRERIAHAKATQSAEVTRKSPLRKVSLNRLEKAIQAQLAQDRQPTDEMKYLAGLTGIQFVFYYPETRDVVIAGPAEGWVTDLSGRVVGLHTEQPIIELQDLVAALRAYPPGKSGGPVIGCSIDPTQEGLARMQEFLRSFGTYATPADTQTIVNGLRTSLGLQQIRIMGVPADTHFAQVMVEADYRMKLIGIGLEPPPVKMVTFIDRADGSIARNALIRWYFIPDYNCVRVSGDWLGMELVGEGIKLVGEDEMVAVDGQRRQAATSGNRASDAFTTSFTQKYPLIAAKSPVYAQLRNLIDVAVAAAFIQQQDYYGQADWNAATLLSEDKLPIRTYTVPVQVDTVVASVWKGNRLLTPVAGGVTIHADRALLPDNLLDDKDGKVQKAHAQLDLGKLAPNQWWWD